jgi:hypothetical protein
LGECEGARKECEEKQESQRARAHITLQCIRGLAVWAAASRGHSRWSWIRFVMIEASQFRGDRRKLVVGSLA